MFSCSDENVINGIDENSSNTTNVSAKTVSDFDELFYQHINSSVYLELDSKINLYTAKMRFTENSENINTEEKMISWILANLDTTNFSSTEEAISEWKEIENISKIVFETNADFYKEVTHNKGRFSELLLHENMKYYTTNSTCKDNLNACNSSAVDQYSGAMEGAFEAYLDGHISGESASKAMDNARIIYSINLDLCRMEYDSCILG